MKNWYKVAAMIVPSLTHWSKIQASVGTIRSILLLIGWSPTAWHAIKETRSEEERGRR